VSCVFALKLRASDVRRCTAQGVHTHAHTRTHTHIHTRTHIYRSCVFALKLRASDVRRCTAQGVHTHAQGVHTHTHIHTHIYKLVYKEERNYTLGLMKKTMPCTKCTHIHTYTHTHIHRYIHTHTKTHTHAHTCTNRVYKEERNYTLGLVKKIKASGCNVLLIQKSILRDATTGADAGL